MPNDAGSRRALPSGWRLAPLLVGTLLAMGGCAMQQAATGGPFPGFLEYQGEEIRDVSFAGQLEFPIDSLRAVVRTRASRCRFIFLPICIPFTNIDNEEHRLDLEELALDVVRLQLYHRDHGYYAARVEPDVDPVDEGVEVAFFIDPGRQVLLQQLAIAGTDTILAVEQLRGAIPLAEGEPFSRVEFLASADTIRQRLLERGYAYADILRNYSIDTISGVAEAEFIAIPGPLVIVDTVVIEGNERVTERTLRRQLAFREGDVLRAAALNDSQRNLYSLDMVNFASIVLADDTVSREGRVHATVRVEVVEAAQYAVEASAGFGTIECFRSSGAWVNRNFLGGGRRLEVNGSVSRVGVGDPLDFGLGESPCTALGEEGFLDLPGLRADDLLDYQLQANLRQPSVLGAQNELALNLHSERVSEADAYIRESIGGRVTAVRELDNSPTLLTTTFVVDRGRTIANPALLCVGFETCTAQDLALLGEYRWSNSLSVGASFDRTRAQGQISTGYVVRGAVDWASSIFLSDDNYFRVLTEAAYYHPLSPGYLLATNVRLGRFLQGGDLGPSGGYIPPERRFYAGGPSSVRGYTRNALGPTTYIHTLADPDVIITAPTGGTQMLFASAELRMPSPWIPDALRLAAFIDAGSVSTPGSDFFDHQGIRFTPGLGIRFVTPVGPFRLDVAYNPYARESGPLYIADPDAGLILDDTSFTPDEPSFLGRFRFQFGLGQAY